MNLISVDKVTVSKGGRTLIENASFGIDTGDKIALIGTNGSGKSSLIRVLTGQEPPDGGTVSQNNNLYLSQVEQHPVFREDENILDFIFRDATPQMKLIREFETVSAAMEAGKTGEEIIETFHDLTEMMEKMGAWEMESRIKSLLSELHLKDFNAPMKSLSGGMVKKAAIVRALAQDFNLLILDEPTNHLDIPTIEWLQEYLNKQDKAVILVTHDRYFLEKICTRIIEIDDQSIYQYKGNYSQYLEQKAIRQNIEERSQARIATVLRQELKWIMRGPRARAGKDKVRTANFYNLMDQQVGDQVSSAEFSSSYRRLGKKILQLKKIGFSYGDKKVINPFSYQFRRGERIGLIGPNGSGKTTFLNLLSDRLQPDTGSIDKGINTHFGYFDQTGTVLDGEQKVVDYLTEYAETITLDDGSRLTPAQLLDRFLFPKSLYYTPIKDISGGERRRLYLIRILLTNPNFLLFDEPTNDLDLQTLTMLEEYLQDFPGCVILVSHDRYFLDRVTDFQFVFDGKGNVSGYAGNYSDYKEAEVEEQARGKQQARLQKGETRQKVRTEKSRKLSFKEKRELSELEEEILILEEEISGLEESFSTSGFSGEDQGELVKIYNDKKKILKKKYSRWEELAALDQG